MSILSTTNTGLHGPVTEDFLLSLGLEKHKYDTFIEREVFYFYNKDILPLSFRITFCERGENDNPYVLGTVGIHAEELTSKEKVLVYLNYVKVTRMLQSYSFNSAEELSKLTNERLKLYNEILK